MYLSFLFHVLSYGFILETEYSSLFYTAGPVHAIHPQCNSLHLVDSTPYSIASPVLLPGNHKFIFYVCELFLFHR